MGMKSPFPSKILNDNHDNDNHDMHVWVKNYIRLIINNLTIPIPTTRTYYVVGFIYSLYITLHPHLEAIPFVGFLLFWHF